MKDSFTVKFAKIIRSTSILREVVWLHNAPEDIRQLIDDAIEASWHTCERCGSTTGVTTNLESYRLTLCPDCRKEIKPRTTIRKRIELHIKK